MAAELGAIVVLEEELFAVVVALADRDGLKGTWLELLPVRCTESFAAPIWCASGVTNAENVWDCCMRWLR